MADNVDITAGSGTTIHADEYTHGTLGSGKTQLVKIVDGVLNAETPLSIVAEDEAAAGGEGGIAAMAVRRDTAASGVGTDGDFANLSVDGTGRLWAHDPVSVALLTTIDSDTNTIQSDTTGILADTAAIQTAVEIMDDWDETNRAAVNVIAGQVAITGGAGAVAANTPRVTLTSDDPAVALLATIDSDTNTIQSDTTAILADTAAIQTAVELLDNAVSGAGYNITQLGGVNVTMGNGASGTGVQRVTIASDTTGVLSIDDNAGSLTVDGTVDLGTGSNTIGEVTIGTATTAATDLAKAHDVALGANDVGVMALAVRDDSLTTLTPVDGDFVPLRVGSTGALHVTGASGATEFAEDVAHTTADAGVEMLAVRRDAKAVGSDTDGDYSTLNVSADGDLRVDGGKAFIVRVAPTVTAGAYSADDVMGGEMTLTASARISGGSGVLTGITMVAEDDAADGFAASNIEVMIFESNPAGTYTDNNALDSSSLTDADAFLLIDTVLLDKKVDLGNITMLKGENINVPYVCNGSADLFAVAINRGGVTPEATNAIQFTFHMIRD